MHSKNRRSHAGTGAAAVQHTQRSALPSARRMRSPTAASQKEEKGTAPEEKKGSDLLWCVCVFVYAE